MRKTLAFIVLLVALVSFSSAFNAPEIDTKMGAIAPNITIGNSYSQFSLSKYRGKYVVINFWSSDDAESRIRNIEISKFANSNENGDIVFAAVNFDRNADLFGETLKIDNLDEKAQFFDKDGINSEVYKQFHLKNGYNCYVINPDGKITAINPDVRQLAEI